MPYKATPIQTIKKHLKSTKDLIARIENELSDERTDKAERTRLLLALAKCQKELRSLESKKSKLIARAKGKMPLVNRLIGLQNLEHVMRGDGCLLACYSFSNRPIRVAIPDSKNQMSMAKYPAFVATRDFAEKSAIEIAAQSQEGTHPDPNHISAETIKSIGEIMGAKPLPKPTHICNQGCYLLGCSIQDAIQDAAKLKAELPEADTVSEPAPMDPVPVAVAPVANTPSPLATNTLRDNPSDAEVSKWLKDITPKGITITPVADLEGETLQYWTDKAAITVKRMRQLYLGFSCTLSSEASMQFDNFQRQLIPMLGKVLYHDPEAVRAIIGDDAVILLGSSKPYEKPVIDSNTQILTQLRFLGKSWAPATGPRFTGYFGPATDLKKE
jgi:hypothetical protein